MSLREDLEEENFDDGKDEWGYQRYASGYRSEQVDLVLDNYESRVKALEQALQKLYLASGPVANCAYNVGQYHEDWENVRHYVSELDNARIEAIKVFRGEK